MSHAKKIAHQNLESDRLCNLNWIRQSIKPEILKLKTQNKSKSFSVIDLFCGCGGMSLGIWEGLRNKGFSMDIKLALDNNKPALAVYQHNFEIDDKSIFNHDINELVSWQIGNKLNAKEILLKDKYFDLDILVAGPPCQGHSNLNNYTRRNDPRNDLYLNVIRFIEIVKPKIVIIENVSTIIHDKKNIVEKSQHFLNLLNYHVESQIINVAEFGLAQTRKRHIQIAVLNDYFYFSSLLPFKYLRTIPLSDYIHDLVNEHQSKKGIFFTPSVTKQKNQERIDYLFEHNLYNLPDFVRPTCHKNKNHSYKSCYGRLHWDKPAQTITSGFGSMGQGRYIHPFQKRVLTPHEAARIQGFPDFFDFSMVTLRRDLHSMIANAVPPKITAMIINSLLDNKILK
jgi:DNA (cytosine-5)-methyltransferase 1